MEMREKYIARIIDDPAMLGLTELKFIHSPQVVTSAAVRVRCSYHCHQARQSSLTPPFCATAPESRIILDEYKFGLMVRREEPVGTGTHPDQMWADFERTMLAVENDCFVRGYSRAFAFAVGNCLYLHHDDTLRPCDYPGKSRPTLESVGIELATTLDMIDWDRYLVREPGEPFQLFALLLLE